MVAHVPLNFRRVITAVARELGMVPVKGFHDPVPAWQVIGASSVDSRFEGCAQLLRHSSAAMKRSPSIPATSYQTA